MFYKTVSRNHLLIHFQPEAITKAVEEALGHFRRIDILINSE